MSVMNNSGEWTGSKAVENAQKTTERRGRVNVLKNAGRSTGEKIMAGVKHANVMSAQPQTTAARRPAAPSTTIEEADTELLFRLLVMLFSLLDELGILSNLSNDDSAATALGLRDPASNFPQAPPAG